MPRRVRENGPTKRQRLRTLIRDSGGPPSTGQSNGLWQTLRWLFRPLRILTSHDSRDPNEIELFVDRLEERRVLNGDFGLLAGVAEVSDLQNDIDLYAEDLLGSEPLLNTATGDFNQIGMESLQTQQHDLRAVLNDGLEHESFGESNSSHSTARELVALPSLLPLFGDQAFGEGTNMAPTFTSNSFNFNLDENSDVGTSVGVATATDGDSPVLTYSITSGNPTGAFSINTSTGEISVADQSAIDFETTPVFSLNVQVDDNNAMMPLNDTATVNITLTDLETSLRITDVTDLENAGVLNFDVEATGDDINQSFDVLFETVDGTAVDALSIVGSDDYTGTSTGSITFQGDSATENQTISIAVNNDAIVEPDESLFVGLLSTTSNDVVINTGTATGTIQNDDVTVISVSDAVRAEGNTGTTTFTFFINSSLTAANDITLNANTVNGSATAGSDYTAITNQTVTIMAGTNVATLDVQINGDTDVELTETFSVVLSDPTFNGQPDSTRVSIGNSGTGAILDDDLANRATLSIDDVTMVEGDTGTTDFVFTVSSDIIAQEDISVTVNTSDLFDAVAGTDYTALTNQVVVIDQGTSSKTVTVSVAGESEVEFDETFAVTLSNPLFKGLNNANAVILGDAVGVGTIQNNDAAEVSISNATVTEGDAGSANLVFTLTSSAVGSRDMDFRVNTADLVDAVAGNDYAALVATTAVISAGSTSTTVSVAVVGDTIVETDETLSVVLSSARFGGSTDASRVTIANDTGVGTIVDDDSTTISINDVTMEEGDGGFTDFVFTLNSTAFTDKDIDVTVNTSNLVEAIGGTDYESIVNGMATVQAGTNTGSLIVRVAADLDVELNETFSVAISDVKFNRSTDATRVTIGNNTGIGTILDDDIATISVDNVSMNEGNAGNTNFVFTISSDVQASRDLSVKVNTADLVGEAAQGIDYTSVSDLNAVILQGSTSTTVTVQVAGEQLVELDETFAVNLTEAKFDNAIDPMKVTIGTAQGIGTIENDDVAGISIDNLSVDEGDMGTTEFVFTITSNRMASEDIAVLVNTADLFEAAAGSDYVAITNQLVTISAGTNSTTTIVTVLTDAIVELNETFAVNLTEGRFNGVIDTNRVSFVDAQGVGTIVNDEVASLSIDNVSMAEGDSGTTDFVFTISSDAEANKAIEVTVNTANLFEAVGGTDYDIISNQVITIAAGSTSATVMVAVEGETTVELDETFEVRLTDAKFAGQTDADRATIANATGVGTIENDDDTFLTINDVSRIEVDAGAKTDYIFTITSTAMSSKDIRFTVNTADVDALAGLDYTAIVNGTETITAGNLSTSVTVTVAGDAIVELDETFQVVLSDGEFNNAIDTERVRFADTTGVGTIENDDSTSITIDDLTQNEGDSGTTDFAFTINSTVASSEDITVVVNTADLLESVAGDDYNAVVNQTATISAGDLSTTFIVQVIGEDIVEVDETFELQLSDARFNRMIDPMRVSIADTEAIGTITNDDSVQLSIDDVSVLEGDGAPTGFVFTVSASAEASRDIDFVFNTADGVEATAGTEYTTVVNQAETIAAGSTSTTITVQTTGDDLVEIDETFAAIISGAVFDNDIDNAQVSISKATGTGTIINDDVATLSIDSVSMTEVDTGGTTDYTFTITSNALASKDIEVAVNTFDLLDVIGGTDYVTVAGTAEITAGADSTTVVVTVNGDDFVELDETFEVRLSAGKFNNVVDTNRVQFGNAIGVGTIVNDDSTTISIDDVSVVEGDSNTTNLEFTISSVVAAGRDIDVQVSTADLVEAVAGLDYAAITNQTATITAGSTSTTFTVLVTGDTILEINETFTATLSDVKFNDVTDVDRVTIAKAVGVGTIENDDGLTVSIDNVTQSELNSGTSNFVFTVSSTASASRDIQVTVATADLTAVAGIDYTAVAPQTVVITAGTTETTVAVEVNGDALVEFDETFAVNLTDALIDGTAVTIADSQGVGTISNDDVANLTIDDVSRTELDAGVTTYTFTVTSDLLASEDIQFTVNTADLVDATAGLDYGQISGNVVTIDAGTNSATIDVTVVGDLIVESNETFALKLSDETFGSVAMPGQVAFTKAQGVGTIENNDSATISIDDVTLVEGNSGNTAFDFTIQLDAVSDHDVTVIANTATLTEAVGGLDFDAITNQTVTIDAGMTEATLRVNVIGEDVVEIDETFSVNLTDARFNGATDATRVAIGTATGVGTIQNDDSATLSIDNVTMNEGNASNTNFVFTISTSATASRNIDVAVETTDLFEALAGEDYVAVDQDVRITAGESSATVTVVVNHDLIVESDETFSVNLSDARIGGVNNAGLLTIAGATGQGTIVNDDTASLSIADIAMDEGTGANTDFVFTVTSSTTASKDIAFTVNTSDLDEAVAGQDYQAISDLSFVINAGETSATVTVAVVADDLVEIDETFQVSLDDALFGGGGDMTRVVIGTDTATGTIRNDDSASLSIDNVSLAEGDAGDTTTFVFDITSNLAASKDIGVQVTSMNLFEALAGADYTAINEIATITAGSTSTTVMVDVLGDDLVELDETFKLNLANATFDGSADTTRVTIADNEGIGTIENDDLASITIDDVSAIEADSGTTAYVFTLTSDAKASKNLTVRVDTATLLDAAAGSDFIAVGQDVVITAGSDTTTVTVDVNGDQIVELDETFEVKLSNARFDGSASPTRVTIADDAGQGTIINNDSTTLSINDIAVQEGDGGGVTAFVFTITSTAISDRDISVAVDTASGNEALAGIDYTALTNQSVVLGAGNNTTTFVVDVAADSMIEIDETFTATISNAEFDGTMDVASRVSISKDTGLATITDDDSATLSIDDVTIEEGDNGATNFVFTVTSTAAASRNIDFTVNTSDLTEAVAGADYAGISSQIERIAIGDTQAQVTVAVIGDTDVEIDETFSVEISNALLDGVVNNSLLSISKDTGIGTIRNDDIASFSVSDVRTAEGDDPFKDFVFTVSTDAIASRNMQVRVDTADLVEAVAGVDYVAVTNQDVVIMAGTQSTDFTVRVIGDTTLEINETFGVNLSNARFDGMDDVTRVAIAGPQGIGTIENDDGLTVAIDDIALAEGDAGTNTSFVFTISSTATSSKDIAITVNTSNFIGAEAGIDYDAIVSDTAIIQAGELTTTVTVNVIGDDLVELDETFSVDLSNAQIDGTIVTIADARGVGTILNDEIATLSVDNVAQLEGDAGIAALEFTVSTDLVASEAISVTINTADLDDALAGTDYAASTQTVIISAGESSAKFTVSAVGDDLVEIDETFTVELSDAKFDGVDAPTRVEIGNAIGIGTITNDDTVTLTIDDVSHVEADSGVTEYLFTITSSGLASKDLSVTVDVPDRMDAVGAPDLNAITAQTATISADTLTTTLIVEVRGDLFVENDETFSVLLTDASFNGGVDPTRVTFAKDTGIGTIVNNDSLEISIDDVSQLESDTGFVFTISSSAVASEDVQVTVDTSDLLEAVAPADYAALAMQAAVIDAGTTSTTVTVTVVDDSLVEIDETFEVNLSSVLFGGADDPSRVSIVDNLALGTIENDDLASISIDNVSLKEGDTNDTTFTFTITSDLRSSKDLGLTVETNDALEALAGVDYVALPAQTVVISAGSNTTTVDVMVQADKIVEVDETFTVDLSDALFDGNSDPSRVTIVGNQGLGTIENDDTASISIDDVAMNEGDAGQTAFTFTVSSDLVSSKDLTVTLESNDAVEAISGMDYTALPAQPIVISAGTTETMVTVNVQGDQTVEIDETFTLDLSDAKFNSNTDTSRVAIGDNSGLGTILNDDQASISIDDVSMIEGDMGDVVFTFTISSDRIASKDLSVTVQTNDGLDAQGGTDYTPLPAQSAVIMTGTNSTTISVAVQGDEIVELDETFNVDLSAALFDGNSDDNRVTIVKNRGVGTIENDDMASLTIDNVTMDEGDSGDTAFTFTITSDRIASKDIGVIVQTTDRTEAIGGTDYSPIAPQMAVITAGENTTVVTVNVQGDQVVEIDETFSLDLSAAAFGGNDDATRVVITDDSGLGTIVNDDTASISIDNVTQDEGDSGDTALVFTISTDLVASKDLSVTIQTNNLDEALAGTDYTAINPQSFTIEAGESQATVTVNVTGDRIVEIDETFTVDLSAALFDGNNDPGRAVIVDNSGLGTITNDDTATLSIDNVEMAEGDSGGTDFVFTISSDLAASKDLGVTVQTRDLLEAVGGTDYTTISPQPATINVGSTSTTVTVNVIGDEIVEIDETFAVDLATSTFNGSGDTTRVNIGTATGIGTIINDDTAALSIDDISLEEGDSGVTNFVFTISSDRVASKDLSFTVQTNDLLEAAAGTDYQSITPQSAVITAGMDSTTLTVAVQGDEVVEIDETFVVNLTDALFASMADDTRVIISKNNGVGTIINDDTASITIDNVSLDEGDSGDTEFVFTISTDLISSKDITLTVNTNDQLEAAGGTDYTLINGQTATIRAGENSTTVTVNVAGDEIVEIDETFSVDLSGALFDNQDDGTRATIAVNQGVGTIINDDQAVLSIDDVRIDEGMSGSTDFVFTISSSLTSSKDLSVTVNTNDGDEALAGEDYTAISDHSAVISAGANSTTVIVSVMGDEVVEIDETFTVDLSAALFGDMADPSRVSISDPSGLGTIVNDDTATLTIDNVAADEGDSGGTSFVFTITTDRVASKDLVVTVDTNDLTEAAAGTDYTAITALPVTIIAGSNTTTVSVNVAGDQIVEINETFTVDLSDARFDSSTDTTRVVIGDASGQGTIIDDDTASLSINNVTLEEGDTGTTDFTFTISTDLISSKNLSVTAQTNDLLEAAGGSDYTSIAAQPIVIAAGTNSTDITVSVQSDRIVEIDETFTVDLSAALFGANSDDTRVIIGNDQGLGTIMNDDNATLSIDNITADEGDLGETDFVFTITSDLTASKDLSVMVETNALREAIADIDFANIVLQPAVIAAGANSTTVTVKVLGDRIVEVDETFTVELSDALFGGNSDPNRVTIGNAIGLGTIVNDDTASLSIDNVTLDEGDVGTTEFTFTISTDLTASKDLSVTIQTNDLLEAAGGTDYTSRSAQPLVISAGTNSTTFTVDVAGENTVEIDETFSVDLSAALFGTTMDSTRVTILNSRGVGTIVNDDTASISIDDVSMAEGDNGNTEFVFTISSDLQSSKDLTVMVNTDALLESVAGTDYEAITSQPANIAAGTNSTTVTVNVMGDEIVEIDETFAVDLSDALFDSNADTTRVNIGTNRGIGTIENDDMASISIDDVSLAEGDTGSTDFIFTISSDLVASKDLTVTVDTNDFQEAVGNTDYMTITAQPAVIRAGTNTATVNVSVVGDQVVEIDETFTVDLTDALFGTTEDTTRVVISDNSGLGTIENDDMATLSIDNVTMNEGDSGDTEFVFTLTSDLVSSKDLSVTASTGDLLEAVFNTDYDPVVSQQTVITAGSNTATITVNVTGDQIVEIDETFTVDVIDARFGGNSDTSRVTIGNATGLGTIVNDDMASLTIEDVTLDEGDTGTTDFTFTISTDLVASKDLSFTAQTNDLLEAVGGTDYTPLAAQPIVITAGTDSIDVTVSVLGDQVVEIDETFTLDLSAVLFDGNSDSTRVVLQDNRAVGTIVNDDTATLAINDVTLSEGDDGTTEFVFTISSDLTSSKDLHVTVDTNDLLEAAAGTDYTPIASLPAVISAGTDSTTVTVNVAGDQIVEVDETFTVDLTDAQFAGDTDVSRVTIGRATGVGTIVNDDVAALSIDNVTLTEGDSGTTEFTFTISSDLQSSKDLSVTIQTNDGLEARSGTDYTAIAPQAAVITAGTNSTTVTVDVAGDEVVEIDETFTVDLSAALFGGGADSTRVNIANSQGLGTIVNDDSATISIDDVAMEEGDNGTTAFVFTITSDLTSSKDLAVTVNTNDLLEAVGGTDYTAIESQSAVIAAGTSATTVTVNVTGDRIVEIDETFAVDLSEALFNGTTDTTRVEIGDGSGLGTIVNDETAALSIDNVTLNEGDSGSSEFVFTITSDLAASKDLSVTVQTNDLLEAVGGFDYTAISARPAVIEAGATSTTVTVGVTGDEIVEVDETFTLDLSAALFGGNDDATRVTILDNSGLGTIVNDDTAEISINDVMLDEGDTGETAFTFTISSSLVASKDLTVTVNTNDLTEAMGGIDYTVIDPQPAVITAGSNSTTVTVNVAGDRLVEVDETFTLDLADAEFDGNTDASRVTITDQSGLGTIVNDDTASISINDVSLEEGDSGTTEFTFTITSDLASSKDLSFTANTNGLLEAVADTDFTAIDDRLAVIEAGTNSTSITVEVTGDRIVELDETFTLDLTNVLFDGSEDVSRVAFSDDSGLGTIVNDDMATLSIDDVSMNEGDVDTTTFVFTISSDLASSKDLGVTVNTNSLLEAAVGGDYAAITAQPAIIAAGSSSTTVSVDVVGDRIVELDETFTVDLSTAIFNGNTDETRVIIGDESGLGTIVNDDTATLSIDNVSLEEGDAGTTNFVFTISSDAIASKNLTVQANSSDLFDAVAGVDYQAISDQSVTIAAGSTTATLTVGVVGDEIVEFDETFELDLSDVQFNSTTDLSRARIGDGNAVGTILNDDLASISIDDVTRSEGDSGVTEFVFTISSDRAASRDLGVIVNAVDFGDVVGGNDLVGLVNEAATIQIGATSTTVTVEVNGDSVVERDEAFAVDLSSVTFNGQDDSSRAMFTDNQGVGTIVNDDVANISINDVETIEGDTGTTNVEFTISMDAVSALDTSLTVLSQDGLQAIENADYFGVPSQDLVIVAGQTSATVTAELIGDAIVELDETFVIQLSDALFGDSADQSRIRISDAIGIGTITNDDMTVITIDDVTAIEGDLGVTEFLFTIRQDAVASLDTSVTVNTADIMQAVADLDYNPITNQVITITAGTRTSTVSVNVIGESLVEATESFRVDLSDASFGGAIDPSRIVLGIASGTGTILNDDAGDFLVEDLVVNESDGTAELTVSLANPIDADATLLFSLEANPDIENLDNQVVFRAGLSQSQSIRFSIEDDILVEGTETYIGFFELMTRADGTDITANVAASIDIIDNDRATFELSDTTINEDAGTVTLTVGIDTPFDIDATFDLSTPPQSDIVFDEPTVTFTSGSTTSQTVTIDVNDDQLVELDEVINISVVPQTDIGDRDIDSSDTGQLEIIDNDSANFTVEDLRVREGDGTVLLTVSVDNPIDIDTTFSILLGETEDLLVETPTITFAGGSNQSQSFSLQVVDDSIEELPEAIGALPVLVTDLGTRDVAAPESVVVTIRDDDTPDFIQDLNQNILTTSVPILVPTTAPGGNVSSGGDGGGSAGGSSGSASGSTTTTATNQAPADAPSDGSSDSGGGDSAAATEFAASIGSVGQESSFRTSQSATQSFSSSDTSAEVEDTSSSQAKNTTTDSEFESDAGELLFHVVLPNGKLGKKFELDIDLLNEDEASLFDRFRGLPSDVYRVLYREPGSDTFQQLFEIYVVDGSIETIAYPQDETIEKIDPADDLDDPFADDAEQDEQGGAVLPAPADDASADKTSFLPDLPDVGRYALPMIAATMAFSKSSQRAKDRSEETSRDEPMMKMDRASRTIRRLMDAKKN